MVGPRRHARWAGKLARSARQRRELPPAVLEARRQEVAPAATIVGLTSTAAVDRWLTEVSGHPPPRARMRAYR